MTTGALRDAYFEKPSCGTQTHKIICSLSFRFEQHSDSSANKFSKVVADIIVQTNAASERQGRRLVFVYL